LFLTDNWNLPKNSIAKEFLIHYNWVESMERLYDPNEYLDARFNIQYFYKELELLINKKYKFDFNISNKTYNFWQKLY